MNKLREVIRQILTTDCSNRQIALSAGLAHPTIGRYRKRLMGKSVDWSKVDKMNDDQVESLVRLKRQNEKKKRIPVWPHIYKQMQSKNMTLQLLWEDYCLDDPDTAYGYSSFTHMYGRFKKKLGLSMRQVHRAGETVFVDFAGSTLSYTRRRDGKVVNAQIFVSAMGCSNYTFAYAIDSQSLPDWIEAHNQMFLFYGGIPEVIVPDNLKSAVTRAGRDTEINRTYLEMCRHYGIVVIPARVRKPKDKAKAEVAVQIVSRWILARLRNRTFFSLEEINKAISELLWLLNDRPFKQLPGCRRSRFEELDKPALRPHPGKVFEYAEWTARQKVGLDYHVRVKGHFYSVPHELVGEYVEARVTRKMVEILYKSTRVASHPRSDVVGVHTTVPAHQPANHRHYAGITPDSMIRWAKSVGPACVAVVEDQFDKRSSILGIKACATLQRLARDYDDGQFEAACKRAQQIGSLTVKSVRSILQRGLIRLDDESVPVQVRLPLHDNVRGADYYAQGGQPEC